MLQDAEPSRRQPLHCLSGTPRAQLEMPGTKGLHWVQKGLGPKGRHSSRVYFELALLFPSFNDPEGPSTEYLRLLFPNTMKSMVFGTRVLEYWVLGPSG